MQAVTDELGDGGVFCFVYPAQSRIRVMAEALDEARLDAAMQRLVTALKAAE